MITWFGKLPVVEKVGWFVLGLISLGVVLVVLYLVLRRLKGWQTLKNIKDDKERISLKIEIIKTAASILGGMFFILTIVVAFLNYRVTQEKHTTDLFTKAIEQLGGNTLEVRLGGIYALERIARDSEKDHGPIMEVLTAYVRANAPWPPEELAAAQKKRPGEKPQEKGVSPPGKGEPEERADLPKLFQAIEAELAQVPPLDADIQAVLTVIGRRPRTFEKGEAQPLDLTNADLRKASLREAHLEGADLREATGLTQEQIDAAYCDEETKLPPHLKLSGKKKPLP